MPARGRCPLISPSGMRHTHSLLCSLLTSAGGRVRVGLCVVLMMECVFLVACATGQGPLPNVSSRVLSLMQAVKGTPSQQNSGLQWMRSLRGVRLDDAGRLEVMIDMTEVTGDTLKDLQARGCAIEIYDPIQRLVQAWIPMDKLREVAGLPFVKFLDLPNYGVTNRPGD